jgi:hypothetical protein
MPLPPPPKPTRAAETRTMSKQIKKEADQLRSRLSAEVYWSVLGGYYASVNGEDGNTIAEITARPRVNGWGKEMLFDCPLDALESAMYWIDKEIDNFEAKLETEEAKEERWPETREEKKANWHEYLADLHHDGRE